MNNSWKQYYKLTRNSLVSPLLLRAIDFVSKKESVLDLGAGAFKDTKYLLSFGFNHVIAVDQEDVPKKPHNNRFKFIQTSFDQFKFPKERFDLINAQFALPFNPPDTFMTVWHNVVNALAFHGVFVGQLFGVNDGWNKSGSKLTFHTKEEAKKLFKDLKVLEFSEVERNGKLANGNSKHWHFFNIIARKEI